MVIEIPLEIVRRPQRKLRIMFAYNVPLKAIAKKI